MALVFLQKVLVVSLFIDNFHFQVCEFNNQWNKTKSRPEYKNEQMEKLLNYHNLKSRTQMKSESTYKILWIINFFSVMRPTLLITI